MNIARIAGVTAACAAVGLAALAVRELIVDEPEDVHLPIDIAADSMRRYAGSDGVVSLPSEARSRTAVPDSRTGTWVWSREALFNAADAFGPETRSGINDRRVTFDEVRSFATSFDKDHTEGLNGDEWIAFDAQYREWTNGGDVVRTRA